MIFCVSSNSEPATSALIYKRNNTIQCQSHVMCQCL